MKPYGFGVDIGGTTIKMGLFETSGALLDKWEIPTRMENGGAYILSDVNKAVSRKCAEKGIAKENVQGIGIGVPGPVNAQGVVNGCVNLGWGVVDVKSQLSELAGLPVQVGNDANVAALGEMWQGGGKGCANVLMVTLGTGVGGGVIVDGQIIAGAHGAGGEIGHMTVEPDETVACNCGRCGCLEQYASATGIVRVAKKYLAKVKALADSFGQEAAQGSTQPAAPKAEQEAIQDMTQIAASETLWDSAQEAAQEMNREEWLAGRRASVLYNMEEITAKDVFDAAKSGDAAAVDITDKVCSILGRALANIAVVADPEVIVLGGGVSKAGQYLVDKVQQYFTEYAFRACKGTQVALAELGNDAGIYGAMKQIVG